MASKRLPPARSEEAKRLHERLRDTLWKLDLAHQALIDLMRSPQRDYLEAWEAVDERQSLSAWSRWATEGVLDLAEEGLRLDVRPSARVRRANCPLCDPDRESSSPGRFAFPIGLKRHLAGSHGNRRCPVFSAAFELALARVFRAEDTTLPKVRPPFVRLRPRPKPWEEAQARKPPPLSAEIIPLRPHQNPASVPE